MTIHPLVTASIWALAATYIFSHFGLHWGCLAGILAFIGSTVWTKGRE